MGQAMAARLVSGGHEVMIYNRTVSKLAPLLPWGRSRRRALPKQPATPASY